MSRYSPFSLVLMAVSCIGSLLVTISLRRSKSPALRTLRIYLAVQFLSASAGLGCIMFGSLWSYYYEWCGASVIEIGAQAVLLTGIGASIQPKVSWNWRRISVASLCVLLSMASALKFGSDLGRPFNATVFLSHVTGSTYCILVSLWVAIAWIRGCAWTPAAAAVTIGFAANTAVSFLVEQLEAVYGYRHSLLIYIPALVYLLTLCLWHGARSLDELPGYTSKEMGHIESAFLELTNTPNPTEVPNGSHVDLRNSSRRPYPGGDDSASPEISAYCADGLHHEHDGARTDRSG